MKNSFKTSKRFEILREKPMDEAKAPESLISLYPSLVDRDSGRHIDENVPSFALFIKSSQASNVMHKFRTRVNDARMTITSVYLRVRNGLTRC